MSGEEKRPLVIQEIPDFDFGVADQCIKDVYRICSDLDTQQSSRRAVSADAQTDFRGYFANIFEGNQQIAVNDLSTLTHYARNIGEFMQTIIAEIKEEIRRRKITNAYVERHDGFWDGVRDKIFGGEEMPGFPTFEPPVKQSDSVRVNPQEHPCAGIGCSIGISSARPENLFNAVTSYGRLDDLAAVSRSELEKTINVFNRECEYGVYGSINADDLLASFSRWIEQNRQGQQWLRIIAQAFEAAGGRGVVSRVSDDALVLALSNAGIDVMRQGLAISPANLKGYQVTTGFANDPVNVATGNFIEPETDIAFTGLASCASFRRMYNSVDRGEGVFGLGWHSVLDQHLEIGDESAVWVRDGGGRTEFPRDDDGWGRSIRDDYWLAATEEAAPQLGITTPAFEISDNKGAKKYFSTDGLWLGDVVREGCSVSVERNDCNEIVKLIAGNGRWISVEYCDGRVAYIESNDGSRVEYIYRDNLLAEVKTSSGSRVYEWNAERLLERVIAATGVVEVENVYDAQARVIAQKTPFGRNIRYAYLPGRVTCVSDADGSVSDTWVSDPYGRLVKIVESHGNTQSMLYDRDGHLIQSVSRDGKITVSQYDARGRRVKLVEPTGAETSYGWDELDRLHTIVYPTGMTQTFSYDGLLRNPVEIKDSSGATTSLTWRDGLLCEVVDPEGVSVKFEYDAYGDLCGIVNAAGNITSCERNAAGQPTKITLPSGAQTCFDYDTAGRIICKHDAEGGSWFFEWDAERLVSKTSPDGGKWLYRYGDHGEIVEQVDPLGRITRMSYSQYGSMNQLVLADGDVWAFEYSTMSELISVTSPEGNQWKAQYDVLGRLISFADPTGRVSKQNFLPNGVDSQFDGKESMLRFDEFGRVNSVLGPVDDAQLISYDHANRPVEIVHTDGSLTLLRRDRAGRVVEQVLPTGQTWHVAYDSCGQVESIHDDADLLLRFEYDVDGRVIRILRSNGGCETFSYDRLGRITSKYSPAGGNVRYTYDACGRVSSVSDAWNGTRSYSWDVAGQLISVTNGAGGVTALSYDLRGRLSKAIDPQGKVTTWTYNELDKVVDTHTPLGLYKNTYDEAGRLIAQRAPDGAKWEFIYDEHGRMFQKILNGKLWFEQRYDDANRRITLSDDSRSHRTHQELSFDLCGNLVRASSDAGDDDRWVYHHGLPIEYVNSSRGTSAYSYDGYGRIVRISDPFFGEISFEYNVGGNLAAVRTPAACQEWGYSQGLVTKHKVTRSDGSCSETVIQRDENARIVAIVTDGTPTTYSYDRAGQLQRVVAHDRVTEWEYDACGKVVRVVDAGQEQNFVYNDNGTLAAIEHDGQKLFTFSYDEAGRRTEKIGLSTRELYTWDDAGYICNVSVENGEHKYGFDVVVDNDGIVASVNSEPMTWDAGAGVPRLRAIGSAPVLPIPGGVLSGGQDGATLVGGSWAMHRAVDASSPWKTSYDGLLAADGHIVLGALEILGHRCYDPSSYSFLSTDPFDQPLDRVWAHNPYSYAANNPLHYVDPLGLEPVTEEKLKEYEIHGGLPELVSWEGLAALGLVVVGTGLTFVGLPMLGGPMIAAGLDVGFQLISSGGVDWKAVAFTTIVTLAAPGLGKIAGKAFEKLLVKSPTIQSVVTGIESTQTTVSKWGNDLATRAWAKLPPPVTTVLDNKGAQLMGNFAVDFGTTTAKNYGQGVAVDTVLGIPEHGVGDSFSKALSDNASLSKVLGGYGTSKTGDFLNSQSKHLGRNYFGAEVYDHRPEQVKNWIRDQAKEVRHDVSSAFDKVEDRFEEAINKHGGHDAGKIYESVEDRAEYIRDGLKSLRK
ncbi:DUF6531 domain-containing protein [Arcanobacterium bovis]|uniref:Type IV secretion protein Rhs n=1 Tax=Arcanobacterium bovis TaxID=2529275 RepID=A0A4Q9V2S1_9ACTO|nr:DUF6531 domain-containing protein [Arcanobacterium bovis]TBW22867.1 hypothetical protein EZJ44_02930 [Arcanobacterium bovis]